MIAPGEKTIVFCQKKHVASWLRKELERDGVACADIHGDRSQGAREQALRDFRSGAISVLVATDVASRGIDVPQVNHVIQFDLPISADEMDTYVHRIGRTGRAGHQGKATAIFVPGFQPKVGNGELWDSLVGLLEENGQPLPPWFVECQPRTSTRQLTADGALVPKEEEIASPSLRRRGASDARRARRAAAAAAAGRAPNAGPPEMSRSVPTASSASSTSSGVAAGAPDQAPSSAAELQACTVLQLKERCRLRSLRVGGTKAELVARLLGATPT